MDVLTSLGHQTNQLLAQNKKLLSTHRRIANALRSPTPPGKSRIEWLSRALNQSDF